MTMFLEMAIDSRNCARPSAHLTTYTQSRQLPFPEARPFACHRVRPLATNGPTVPREQTGELDLTVMPW